MIFQTIANGNMSLLSKLHDIDPTQFEIITGLLFVKMGYCISHTGKGPDGGVDLFVYDGIELEAIIQCKRFRTNVSEPVVRDLFGVMNHFGAKKGFVVTTADFTNSAFEWSRGKMIELINGKKFVELLTDYGLERVIYRKDLLKHEPGDYWSKRSDTVFSSQIDDSTRYDLTPFVSNFEVSQHSNRGRVESEKVIAMNRYRRQRAIESKRKKPSRSENQTSKSNNSDNTVFERRVIFPARKGEYSNEPDYQVQDTTRNSTLQKFTTKRTTSVGLFLFVVGLLAVYTHFNLNQNESHNRRTDSSSAFDYLDGKTEGNSNQLFDTNSKIKGSVNSKESVAFVLSNSCKLYNDLELTTFFRFSTKSDAFSITKIFKLSTKVLVNNEETLFVSNSCFTNSIAVK